MCFAHGVLYLDQTMYAHKYIYSLLSSVSHLNSNKTGEMNKSNEPHKMLRILAILTGLQFLWVL